MKLYVLPATKLLIVAIPFAKQVGATIIIVGAGGVINWKSIESAYRTSPFFEFYEDDLKPLFSKKSDELTSFNFECISRINECIDFKFNYSISETFKKKYDGKDYRFLIETKNNLDTIPKRNL